MLNRVIQPTSLVGIKRRATQLKRLFHVPHHEALDLAAQDASFQNFRHARSVLGARISSPLGGGSIFLTVYWSDPEISEIGRETLSVQLFKPLLGLFTRSEIKSARGLSWFRIVADDHLVADEVFHSQESARRHICMSVRVLGFMEISGLRPSSDYEARFPNRDLRNELPDNDHATDWYDPETGQFVLIDEPYLDPIIDAGRKEWAKKHGWHIEVSKWPGMYSPYDCSLFVATDASKGYDFDSLMRRIDSIPEPITEHDWRGESAKSHKVFLSPLALTRQDKRRAKAKGTIYREASRKSIPLATRDHQNRRKPNAVMSVRVHQEIGQTLKAVNISQPIARRAWSSILKVRSALEDWLYAECGAKAFDDGEYTKIYYGRVEAGLVEKMSRSKKGRVVALLEIEDRLLEYYPDCEPLRRVLKLIETAIRNIEKM